MLVALRGIATAGAAGTGAAAGLAGTAGGGVKPLVVWLRDGVVRVSFASEGAACGAVAGPLVTGPVTVTGAPCGAACGGFEADEPPEWSSSCRIAAGGGASYNALAAGDTGIRAAISSPLAARRASACCTAHSGHAQREYLDVASSSRGGDRQVRQYPKLQ